MIPQEAATLDWMDLVDRPISDTEIKRQFPRLWPGFTTPLLQHAQIERYRRPYRLTSHEGRKEI